MDGKRKGKRKGNDIFDRVIRKVVTKYGSIVDYRIVSGVTYEEYIKTYESAHIFIDQLYAEDKGYNALLGMAAGKVVFSGYNNQVLNTYPNYDGKIVGMDVTTDESTLFDRFCLLIDNPSLMEEISRNAIDFVIKITYLLLLPICLSSLGEIYNKSIWFIYYSYFCLLILFDSK